MGLGRIHKKINVKRTSDFIGVYKNKKEKWIAQIRLKRKRVYLGIFDTEINAAIAFDNEYVKYYKTKFGLNFPNGIEKEIK